MWLSLLRFKSFMAFLRVLPAPMTVCENKVSSKGLFEEGKKGIASAFSKPFKDSWEY